MFSCDNLGDCIVYECLLQEPMEANGDATASIEIDFTFSKVTLVYVYFPQLLVISYPSVTSFVII